MQDARGAVLIIAVFAAVFLVGALWYLVGIGDAAIYREKMQDGADAVAFAAAVYHARGMNIIAMLNLIMAAALAVLIALEIAKMLAFIIAFLAGISGFFSFGSTEAIAAEATEIGTNLQNNVIPRVKNLVDTVLKACSDSQRWVAVMTPWVASARAYVASTSYAPTVQGGVALSVSMMPSGDRLGLPVQEDSFDVLCKRAGELLGDLAFGWIPGMNSVASLNGQPYGHFPKCLLRQLGRVRYDSVSSSQQHRSGMCACAATVQQRQQEQRERSAVRPEEMPTGREDDDTGRN